MPKSLIVLFCVAIFGVSACVAQTPIGEKPYQVVVRPSQKSLMEHEIGEGEIIRLHWEDTDTPLRLNVREEIFVIELADSGISTLNRLGRAVAIPYDEIALIEYGKLQAGGSSLSDDWLLWLLCLSVGCTP